MSVDRSHLAPPRPPMNRNQSTRPKEPIINGQVVKDRRRQLGITQVQLSIMSACNPTTIRKIERGHQIDPPTSITLRIAKSLAITVEALCRGARPYQGRISRVGHKHTYDENLEV